ncbi:MAG TPA: bifunctional riboflavin kinase/FAD synthetase [Nitriliruptorales bacterium]|nr:bifunctional riboflavin kinase/FAD synthetase [Nitriliruptorales bacterium]
MTAVPSTEQVWRSLEAVDAAPCVATIGFFDGVHRGHRALVDRARRAARRHGVRAVAVTFDRHPMEVVRPGEQPPLLTTLERRVRALLEAGVDRALVLPFTEELSRLSPSAFVERVIVDVLDARLVVVGTNFRFGHRAAGDVAMLTELGAARGVEVEAVDVVHLDGVPISSTEIRRRLADGDVTWAREALGRPHLLDGVVVRGDRRGRRLGVPTLNVEVPPILAFPANGVYAGHVTTPAGRFAAVTSVGTRPTFGGDTVTVESHLLDFDGDLYGAHVEVEFAHRLRDEVRFDSVSALVAAMHDDIARGRELLAPG